jgi:hypothetical protein
VYSRAVYTHGVTLLSFNALELDATGLFGQLEAEGRLGAIGRDADLLLGRVIGPRLSLAKFLFW